MADLIGSPLSAACDAQLKLATATANFIKTIGFLPNADAAKAAKGETGDTRMAKFGFTRTTADATAPENVELSVPMLAIVKIPSLAITRVNITFDMEVKSSSVSKESSDTSGKFSADASVGWGCFSLKVHVEGAVSSHKENTRSSDNSAKYHVEVHAEDNGMPEGLARVLDIIQQSIVPPASKLPAQATG